MEVRQLEHFVAVAEEQSFTRAARVSTPARPAPPAAGRAARSLTARSRQMRLSIIHGRMSENFLAIIAMLGQPTTSPPRRRQ